MVGPRKPRALYSTAALAYQRAVPRRAHFGAELFEFLRDLRANNRREWFLVHRARWEADVRDPMLRFIADFGPRLRAISRSFVADPRPVGGSMFRIHRDVRFSRDRSPYKTTASAQFRHEAGRDVHAPGFYLHLQPGNVFAGAGLWRPDGAALGRVRDAIVTGPARWRRAIGGRAFRARCTFGGESLKRPPHGYDPAHPLIADLMRKDFVVATPFTEADACRADFLDAFAGACGAAAPMVAFLTRALGLPYRLRRR